MERIRVDRQATTRRARHQVRHAAGLAEAQAPLRQGTGGHGDTSGVEDLLARIDALTDAACAAPQPPI